MKTAFEMFLMWWMMSYMYVLMEQGMEEVEEVWNPYNDTCLANI